MINKKEHYNILIPKNLKKISSIDELQKEINIIRQRSPELKLVFRGQTHNYDPVASAARKTDDAKLKSSQAIYQSTWDHTSTYLLNKYCIKQNDFRDLIGSMGILQHYGFKSWFIDVTTDPIIGTWFSVNKYVPNKILVQPKPLNKNSNSKPILTDQSYAVVSTAMYQRSLDKDGVLFVFGFSELEEGVFLLDKIFSNSALRVHRQKAGELVIPLDNKPLSTFIVAKFIIDKSIILPKDLTPFWLFPPPTEDSLYYDLLKIPYIIPHEETEKKHPLAYPFLVNVPVYQYKDSPDNDTLKLIRNLAGMYAPLCSNYEDRPKYILPISRFPETQYSVVADKPNILLPKDSIHVNLRMRRNFLNPVNLNVWDSKRFFLMYPVSQMMPTFLYRESIYPLFRGLFVDIIDENKVVIEPIFEDLTYVRVGDFNPDDKQYYLEDFYYLTERIQTGDAVLIRKDPFVHYEWKNWNTRDHNDPLENLRDFYNKNKKNAT